MKRMKTKPRRSIFWETIFAASISQARKLFIRCCTAMIAGIAPTLIAATANANELDLNAFKGKVVYLDFWASWCIPCRQSFPWMSTVQSDLADRGFVIVAVDLDKDRAAAEKFLRANHVDFQILYDPNGALASAYAVKAMPSAYLIGRDGEVRFTHQGFYIHEESNYVSQINALLAEKTP